MSPVKNPWAAVVVKVATLDVSDLVATAFVGPSRSRAGLMVIDLLEFVRVTSPDTPALEIVAIRAIALLSNRLIATVFVSTRVTASLKASTKFEPRVTPTELGNGIPPIKVGALVSTLIDFPSPKLANPFTGSVNTAFGPLPTACITKPAVSSAVLPATFKLLKLAGLEVKLFIELLPAEIVYGQSIPIAAGIFAPGVQFTGNPPPTTFSFNVGEPVTSTIWLNLTLILNDAWPALYEPFP